MGRIPALLASLVAIASAFAGCAPSGNSPLRPADPRPWTVLVYWAVDNDLYEFSRPYIRALEEVGSTDAFHLVVEYDYPGSRPTERIRIGRSSGAAGGDLAASTVVDAFPDRDSADPAALADFLRWGMRQFPSDRLAVVIASHGSNWSGAINDATSRSDMSLEGLRSALSVAEGAIDLLVFDACRMAFQETVHALAGAARWIAASPFDVNGFDHVVPLRILEKEPGLDGRALGTEYIRAYAGREGNRDQPLMAASLLSTKGAIERTRAIERVFGRLLARSRERLPGFWRDLPRTINEEGDWAMDLEHVLEAARRLDPGVRAKRILRSAVEATGRTDLTEPSSGLSLTCAKELEKYADTPVGRSMPAWVELCRIGRSAP